MGPDVSPGAVSNRRILIVDDEEMVRQTLAFGLEDAGFAVETAEGGAEALELLRAGRVPDAVVSDFSMPGMDGVALIREIQGLCPRLPAALLTGYAPTDARIAAAGVLANDVPIWRKPVSIRQLVTDVEALLATAG
jgi:CheY-like chemotaxis protein